MHTKISGEYVSKVRRLRTPLSHARHSTHTKISGEYVIKKRLLNMVSDNRVF